MIDARIQGGVFNPVEAIALDLALGVVGVTVAVSDHGVDARGEIIQYAAQGESVPADGGVVLRPIDADDGQVGDPGKVQRDTNICGEQVPRPVGHAQRDGVQAVG